MSKVSQGIIGLCIAAWFVLAIGVCGGLDCSTMEIEQALDYIKTGTKILLGIIVFTVCLEKIIKSLCRKERKEWTRLQH